MDYFEQHVDLDLHFILPPPQEKEGWMGWGEKRKSRSLACNLYYPREPVWPSGKALGW